MLCIKVKTYHQVRAGQTLASIAKTYGIATYLLARENGLTEEPWTGQILYLPQQRGNAYTAQPSDDKKLLCGNDAAYAEKNGTDILYPGMRVIL